MVEFVDYKPITVDPSTYTVDSEIPDISYFTEETTPSTKTSTTPETSSSSTYKFKWTSSLPISA
jgi:cell wall-associated NlpC family hydrolase